MQARASICANEVASGSLGYPVASFRHKDSSAQRTSFLLNQRQPRHPRTCVCKKPTCAAVMHAD